MSNRDIIVRLKGGLGNQMFQYAAGLALAIRNDAELLIDVTSGFARDRVFQRTFSLNTFPLQAREAGISGQLPFWFEQIGQRYKFVGSPLLRCRPWGTFIGENELRFLHEVVQFRCDKNVWMEGYWQSENYFADCHDAVFKDFTITVSENSNFLRMARMIETCNSVSVGVRLFEELPGIDKSGVGGLVPFSFYESAANRLVDEIGDSTFFVFSTTSANVLDKLNLPGEIFYITPDNGFDGVVNSLWLISRCSHHILSNSSFYWWGAWLGERGNPGTKVIACDLFPNQDTIPSRWAKYGI
jgi:hypothetical protein